MNLETPPLTGRSSALLAEISGAHNDSTLSVLGDRGATEVMVPRTETADMSKDETVEECISLFRETKFTRYPVIDGDKDRVIGFVNFKEVIAEYVSDPVVGAKCIKHFIRPVIRDYSILSLFTSCSRKCKQNVCKWPF